MEIKVSPKRHGRRMLPVASRRVVVILTSRYSNQYAQTKARFHSGKTPGRSAMRRSLGVALIAALFAAAATAGATAQEAPKSIKVGYVISLSGPQSAGAMLTTVPNYRLWVDEVNKAGGLMLKKYNKRVPVEVSEIDDRSNNED